MVRARDAQLVEEEVGELGVVVLAAVHQHLVDPRAQGARESGAAFTNCGRLPTIETILTARPSPSDALEPHARQSLGDDLEAAGRDEHADAR